MKQTVRVYSYKIQYKVYLIETTDYPCQMLRTCQAELRGISRTERITLGHLKMAKQLKEIRKCFLPPAFGRKEGILPSLSRTHQNT